MEKRVTFRGWMLPLLLIAPQVVISAVFFFYPAGQAIWQSLFIPDPFGLSSQFVGMGNFEFLLGDKFYRAAFLTTAIFSILVTLCSMIPALFLAVLADRLIKGLGRLPHTVDLALCGRPGRRRCTVAVYVQHPCRRDLVVSGSPRL